MSEVSNLIDQLAAGKVGLGAVAADFATRDWTSNRPPASNYETEALRELEDPGLIPADSWLEVEAAYLGNRISEDVYRVLYQARGTSG